MKTNIHGNKLEITESIKSYIIEKLGKLDKYFENPEELTATISLKVRGKEQRVEITIPIKKAILRCEESNGDLYISIHLNSIASSTWRGAQVFYDDINPKNEKLAKLLQNTLKKDLKSSREYKEMTDMYMYKRIKIPGVLVEVGFLSNDNERYLLLQKTYQDKVAKSLCGGIIEYFHS